MNQQDRQAIEGIFQRIEEVQRQGTPRDPEAERLIAERLQANPAAAYYLAQTVVVQEQALKGAKESAGQGLKQDDTITPPHGDTLSAAGTPLPRAGAGNSAPAGSEGFGRSTPSYAPAQPAMATQFGNSAAPAGGGFLAGAAQTALGVTGGVLLGSMIGGMFGNNAHAADANKDAASNTNSESSNASDNTATTESADDGGGLFGDWFGGGGGGDGGGFDDI